VVRRNTFIRDRTTPGIVTQTEREDGTWFACDGCGMLFDARENAEQHETDCDGEEPSYIQ
jgi:hypothetical protein